MSEPRFQHNQEELGFIIELLEFLNRDNNKHDCMFEGELELYWSDCVMGRVARSDQHDPKSWCHFPIAQGDKPQQAWKHK